MNRVHYGWIFNKIDGVNSDGEQLYKATRTRSCSHNEPKKETIVGSETDLIEIINRIAKKEARDDTEGIEPDISNKQGNNDVAKEIVRPSLRE